MYDEIFKIFRNFRNKKPDLVDNDINIFINPTSTLKEFLGLGLTNFSIGNFGLKIDFDFFNKFYSKELKSLVKQNKFNRNILKPLIFDSVARELDYLEDIEIFMDILESNEPFFEYTSFIRKHILTNPNSFKTVGYLNCTENTILKIDSIESDRVKIIDLHELNIEDCSIPVEIELEANAEFFFVFYDQF
ncbi:ATP-dependent RNA helicase [Carp edema virus]|nr:ATP-dependent RNA helicase [Carp edema virus]